MMTDAETIAALRAEVEWLDAQIADARSLALTGMYQAHAPGVHEQFRAIASRLAGVLRTTSATVKSEDT